MYTVVRDFDGSRTQVRHPQSIKDSFKWNRKRHAIAALTRETRRKLAATEEGNVKQREVEEQAGIEIESSTTWSNLNRVVAIAVPLPNCTT